MEDEMQAVRINTTINADMVRAVPELLPMMGCSVELIALNITPEPQQNSPLSFDELLQHRLERPEQVDPVSLDDMELAIATGATDGSH